MVPLSALLNVRPTSGPERAMRYNGFLTADVNGRAAPGYSSGQAQAAVERIAAETLPPGMRFEWTELTYQEILAGNTAVLIFPLSILLVFLVLAALYESLVLPLAIILIVPMALFGALTGVWLTHGDNNIFTQIGLMVLVGLSAKNSILIVEFARELEFAGHTPVQAAIEAARLRLRPILMTSTAFVMGVVPLAFATGAGAEMRRAMGVAVFSGMIGVTAFGIFLTPVFYVALRALCAQSRPQAARRGRARRGLRRRLGLNRMNSMNTMMRTLLALAVAILLAGCAERAAHRSPRRCRPTPAAFKERDPRWTPAAPAEAQPRGEWWKAFADPVLDDLVERADRANTSIQVAAARLVQARALVQSADADRMPQLGIGASALRGDGLSVTNLPAGSPRTLYAAAANASYELDLFGRLAQASRAAQLDAHAAEALLRSTKLLAQADVAQAYLGLRALDDERALVRRTVAAYRVTLDLTERRYRAGDVAELDVTRARTEVAATESEAFALDRQRAELEHAIAVLVGEPASTFSIKEDRLVHGAAARFPAGRAVDRAHAPSRRVGRAGRHARGPGARGSREGGMVPEHLAHRAGRACLDGSLRSLRLAGARVGDRRLLAQPIFDGGEARGGHPSSRAAQMDVAVAHYREQVLVAFRDVEDQLAALRLLAEQSDAQARAVSSAARTTALSDARYRNGLVSQLELLDAQRSELRNRRQALEVRSAQYQATVGLVRALGGGWGEGS